MAEPLLGRYNKGGKAIGLAVEYGQKLMIMDNEDHVRHCYEWKQGNRRLERWGKKRHTLDSIGTAYIWNCNQGRNISIIRIINRQICNDNEVQNLFSMMSVISLLFYQNIKYNGAENYTEFCSRNDRSGLVSMRVGVRKLRGIRRGMEK
jgi:hypothetical protein